MLEKIEILNFLSIRERQVLKVSNKLTTIIGENASGKSAILKAVEKLNGNEIEEKEKNILLKENESEIKAFFKIDKKVKKMLNQQYKDEYPNSIIKYNENDKDIIFELITNDDEQKVYKMYYDESKEEYDLLNENIKSIISEINNITKNVELEELKKKMKLNAATNIDEIKAYWEKITDEEMKQISREIKNKIDLIINEIESEQYDDLIPEYEFIYFNSFKDLLVDSIAIDEAEENIIVKNFLNIADIDIKKVKNAIEKNDIQYIRSIENKTVEIMTENFKKIFSQISNDDKFELSITIDTGTKKIFFWVKNQATGANVLKFSDESEGTQWYLSMYLRLYEYFNQNSINKSYILLLDEPNVYLNATAQRDLLNNVFKENLSDMQIIYTTHSPYMIDAGDLYSLRVIHKDDETRIFNTTLEYLSYRESTTKRKDVDGLSPVLIATGINVSNQLILDKQDVLVVVEGPHDYYVLNAIMKILNLQLNIKFIPCTGCEKVPFMCGYLVGLGYEVLALVDNDVPGRRVINQMKKQNENGELYKIICYSKENETGDCILENLFSENDCKEKIGKKSTPNYRKLFYGEEQIEFDEETKKNFKYIFEVINNYIKK